jgi:hypothetical protein
MSHKLVSLYIGDGEYYTRTDADAVIAELKADYKEACDRLQTANLIKDEQFAAARHHKFKRCLAMAERCKYRMYYLSAVVDQELSKIIPLTAQIQWYAKRERRMDYWKNRWLELAEQFKEGDKCRG